MNIAITIILGVAGFMVLVASHEFGHFLFAKLFKIRVPTFSIGMGPKIFGFKRNGTDFIFSIFPIGGYVHVYGMEKGEMKGEPDEFLSKPLWKQYLVIFGGPLFSFLLGILLFYISIMGFGIGSFKNTKVLNIKTDNKTIQTSILQGDSIISINNKKIIFWDDMYSYFRSEEENLFQIKRGNEILDVSIKGEKSAFLDRIVPELPPVIGQVEKNGIAAKAGLKSGDIILTMDTVEIKQWNEFVDIIRKNANTQVSLSLLRGIDTVKINIIPKEQKILDGDSVIAIGYVGALREFNIKRVNPFYGCYLAVGQSISTIKLISYQVGLLLSKKVSTKELGGPLAIIKLTGQSMNWGVNTLLGFIAFITINLALINMIPFPPLDGGQIILFTLNRIFGKKLSDRIMGFVEYAGFGILILLMLYVTYNDVLRLFHK